MKRNLLLIVLLVGAVLVYVTMTVPALERDRRLAELEQRMQDEIRRLWEESRRLEQQLEALESQDPAVLERALRSTFQHGISTEPAAATAPAAPADGAESPRREGDGAR